ncbi:hypothetical protein AUR04nite_34120 [Glutamicibacter uratoxydans]|uniref:Uncharacterized protein n=1 Tax=Glutamicibacter uratoxydans TaxID=43667 RepID=A0A4Y4DWT8_GLUUR|nr:hypothetical protein AUR04nite_34120 [Glutamicibacter uratoxydans]
MGLLIITFINPVRLTTELQQPPVTHELRNHRGGHIFIAEYPGPILNSKFVVSTKLHLSEPTADT